MRRMICANRRGVNWLHDAPGGGLWRGKPDLLAVDVADGRPARLPHGDQLRRSEQDLLVHRGLQDLMCELRR